MREKKEFLRRPVIDPVKTGQHLKELRKSRGIKVKDFYPIFGFAAPQAVYSWEAGHSVPSIDNFIILSDFYGLPIDDLIVTDQSETE